MSETRMRVICSLLLLLAAVIWGAAFVAQSVGMDYVGPWTYVLSRYALSTVVLIPVTFFADCRNRRREVRETPLRTYLIGGSICGGFLAFASISQQAGIRYTTAGKAGFITALYVVFVPVISLFLGRRPEKKIWLCVFLGIAGLYLISVKGGFGVGAGDALMVLCALLFSGQIILVGYFSRRVTNVVKLANFQFFFCMLVNLIGTLLFEEVSVSGLKGALPAIVYAGVFSGAVGYTLQIVAQKYTDPTVASLLMCLESVFSALFGWVILGEVMTGRELFGCACVFLAAVLSELPLKSLVRRARGHDSLKK